MAVNFITETEVTGLTAAAWTTVSAPAGVPAGATGIFGYVTNSNATYTTARMSGFRHPDDTRDVKADERGTDKAKFFICGLNGSKEFEYYVETQPECQIFVTGYFDSEATFKTAAVSLADWDSNTGWQRDVDLTTDTAADAVAVILEITNATAGRQWGAQSADDTLDEAGDRQQYQSYTIVPMATGQLIDLRLEDTYALGCRVHIIGYLTGGVVDTLQTDVTPASDATWTAVTNPSATATAAMINLTSSTNSDYSTATWGIRKKGATAETMFPNIHGAGGCGLVELDASADYDVYLSDVTTNNALIYQMMTLSAAPEAAARPTTIGIGNLNNWIK